jgi:WD40 repeat protein
MVARGAGDVGCAHCTVIGADRACQVCTRQVCETCGADWTTCPEPTGREVRLGRTARLRDVDPAGRLGLVTRWVGGMRLLDIRRLRWISTQLAEDDGVHDKQIVERLTPNAELYTNHYAWEPGDQTSLFASLRKRSLVTGEVTEIEVHGRKPSHNAGMTSDGHYYYVSAEQLVVIVAPDGTSRAFEPMPRRVVQACHVDMELGILVSATWGEILIHRIIGDALMPLAKHAVEGNVSWVALEEPFLAACVEDHVHAWRVGENLAFGREVHQELVGHAWHTGALSRDGRYLAIGVDRKVILHDLEQDSSVTFEDHTDDICTVRFAGTDQLLVTADEDNRVVIRPRVASGYVRSTIDIDIPDEPVKLQLDDSLVPR